MNKNQTASKINSFSGDYFKRQGIIRNILWNLQGKYGDNIVNFPLHLDYHAVVIIIAFETLLLLFLISFEVLHTLWQQDIDLSILYESLTFVSTFQKCCTAK